MKKPRWEKKFEEYVQNEKSYISLKGQATKLKAKIEVEKDKKVEGNFKSREEYEVAKTKQQEVIDSMNEKLVAMKEKIKGYDYFVKNKKRIENIWEYRKTLEEELEKLPKDSSQKIAEKQKEQAAIEQRVEQYKNEMARLTKRLKEDLSEEERNILQYEFKAYKENLENLQNKQNSIDEDIAQLQKDGEGYNEKVEWQKNEYERKIAKCNILASNLLKGKEIDDISLNNEVAGKTFTSKDGKLEEKTNRAREDENIKKTPEVASQPKKEEQQNIKEQQNNTAQQKIEETKQIATVGRSEAFKERHPGISKVIDSITKFFARLFKSKKNVTKGQTILDNMEYKTEETGEEKKLDDKSEIIETAIESELREAETSEKAEVAIKTGNKQADSYDKEDEELREIAINGHAAFIKKLKKMNEEKLSRMNEKSGYIRPTAEQRNKFIKANEKAKPQRDYMPSEKGTLPREYQENDGLEY